MYKRNRGENIMYGKTLQLVIDCIEMEIDKIDEIEW